MRAFMILFDPQAKESLALVQALSQISQADLVAEGQINVIAAEKDVNAICDQYPDIVLKAELIA